MSKGLPAILLHNNVLIDSFGNLRILTKRKRHQLYNQTLFSRTEGEKSNCLSYPEFV